MSKSLVAALDYFRRGFSIIPVRAKDKIPLVPWDEFQERRATEEEIKGWWNKWPEANVGIVTGAISRIVVIDIDSPEARNKLKELLPDYNVTSVPRSRTAKGCHLFFKHPGVLIPNRTGILPQVDVRGDGGFVVAPPSDHPSGVVYRWEVPLTGELPALPKELLKLITAPVHQGAGQTGEKIRQGQRNATLTSLAGTMRKRGMAKEAILAALVEENRIKCDPPLLEREVEAIAHSVSRYEPKPKSEGTTFEVVSLADLEEPGPMQYEVASILPMDHPTIIYGDGGMGKSYMALALDMCKALGTDFLGLETRKGPVLYLDWELDLEEQTRRAYRVARGLGLEKPPAGLLYLRAAGPISSINKEVRGLVQAKGVELVTLDSIGLACRGDPEAAQVAINMFATLRELGCTVLGVDHQAKLQEGQHYQSKTIFGSVFKFNYSRSVLQMQVVAREPGAVKLILRPTKSNFGPLAEPIGLRMTFGRAVVLERIRPGEDADFRQYVTLEAKILPALEKGPATAEKLASELGEKPGSVKNALTKLKSRGLVQPVGKDGRADVYALSVTSSHPIYSDDDVTKLVEAPAPWEGPYDS